MGTHTLKTTRIELHSPHPPAECASRLSAAIDAENSALLSLAGVFGNKPFLGRVTETSLHLRKRIAYRNSFQSMFSGTMRPSNGGTVITGDFAMHPFVIVFMAVWFCGVLGIGGTLAIATIAHLFSGAEPRGDHDWLGIVAPVGMAIFGVALVAVGRYIARQEAQFITDFLTRTLDAAPNPSNA